MTPLFVSYLRVSTKRQHESGLGVEAQRAAVGAMIRVRGGRVIEEFVEAESGRQSQRPKLAEAAAYCRQRGATLIVAKLDRLARDARFLLELVDSRLPIVFCDFPQIGTGDEIVGRLVLTMLAAIAEFEGRQISRRTKDALAAAKRRGVKLGGARKGSKPPSQAARARGSKRAGRVVSEKALRYYAPIMDEITALRQAGKSLRQIAEALNEKGLRTQKDNPFNPQTVLNLLNNYSSSK